MINAIVIDQVSYVNTGLTDDFLLNHKGAKEIYFWGMLQLQKFLHQ